MILFFEKLHLKGVAIRDLWRSEFHFIWTHLLITGFVVRVFWEQTVNSYMMNTTLHIFFIITKSKWPFRLWHITIFGLNFKWNNWYDCLFIKTVAPYKSYVDAWWMKWYFIWSFECGWNRAHDCDSDSRFEFQRCCRTFLD